MTLRDQLLRDEGCVLHAYLDSLGFWTIGVGHLVDASWKDKTITQDEAMKFLDDDIAAKTSELYNKAPWVKQIDGVRQACLLNMAFNLGVNGLLKFKNTLLLIQAGKFVEASREMLNSTWAVQVGPRSRHLSQQLATGQMV